MLQLRERQSMIKSIKASLKETEFQSMADSSQSLPNLYQSDNPIQMLQDIDALQMRWSSTCTKAKKDFSKLSLALKNANFRGISPLSSSSGNSTGPNSRHTTPDEASERTSQSTKGNNRPFNPYDIPSAAIGSVVTLDSLLDSLKLEVERQAESAGIELTDETHIRSPPLPKPSVLSNSSHATKNNQLQYGRDKTRSFKRHSSSPMNGSTRSIPPPHPPPKPERKKPQLKVNNSCPSFPLDLLPNKKSHSVVQIRPLAGGAPCRLAKKISDVSGLLKRVESIVIPSYPCELKSVCIEGRLSAIKVHEYTACDTISSVVDVVTF